MVLSLPASRWTLPLHRVRIDRATAIALAIAVNALLLLMLSLPQVLPLTASTPSTAEPVPAPPERIETVIVPRLATPQPLVPTPQPVERPVKPDLAPALTPPPIVFDTAPFAVPVAIAPEVPIAAAPTDAAPTTGAGAAAQIEYVEAPLPPYPPLALRRGWEGTVTLRVLVGTDGRPERVEIAQGSGHSALDRSASKHVLEHWRFAPAMRDGRAVPAWALVPIDFKLDSTLDRR